jgi:hypothetical protein
MGKYLKLGGDAGGERWTLPEHADVETIRKSIEQAMADEKPLRIAVAISKDQTAELIVNGGEITAAIVWEDTPAGGGMTIID